MSWVDEILGPIREIETIAAGRRLRIRWRLRDDYGAGNWRKMKGVALIRDIYGECYEAEIHWYDAHGIGRREVRVKHRLSA